MVYSLHSFFQDVSDEFWKRTIEYFAAVPELNYMTQIVLMLYEDPQVDKTSDMRFHIELHFSPGVKCHIEEAAAKDSRLNAFLKEHKNFAFKPTVGQTQAERSGSEHSRLITNKQHASTSIEEEAETSQTDAPKHERKSSTEGEMEPTQKISPKFPRLEATGLEDKRNINSRRQNSGRSRSECEYPAKSLDNLDESGGNNDDGSALNKATSKSLGKCMLY